MKEAAGEANLTVVAIILIGVIVAIATPLIGSLMDNAAKRSCCIDSGGTWNGSGTVKCLTPTAADDKAYNDCISNANVN